MRVSHFSEKQSNFGCRPKWVVFVLQLIQVQFHTFLLIKPCKIKYQQVLFGHFILKRKCVFSCMKSNITYATYCKSYPINYPHYGKFRNPESILIVYSDKFLLSEIFRSRHDSPAPISPNGLSGAWGNKGTWPL